MKTIAFHNLGCKVNAYETDVMMQNLQKKGWQVVPFDQSADVYVVNTCTVTNIADRKSRQMLHRAKKINPDAVVVAVGCYVETDPEGVEKDPAIDLAIGTNRKGQIAEIVEAYLRKRMEENGAAAQDASTPADGDLKAAEEGNTSTAGRIHSGDREPDKTLGGLTMDDIQHHPAYESMMLRTPGRTRADVKIQDGCNQFCSYCIIPYARGRVRSRRPEEVLEEVKGLAAQGVREVVITGIHIGSYGLDWEDISYNQAGGGNAALLSLLRAIAGVEGIERIRLGSLEPRVMSEEFVAAIAEEPKICPHFHLSLQSGCDSVLARMNRHYTAAEFLAAVDRLRRYYDRPALTTDVIVGFPGETDEEFEESRRFLESVNFYEIHVFPYSRRHGTVADQMPGQITEAVKAGRSRILQEMTVRQAAAYRKSFIGEEEEILPEEHITEKEILRRTQMAYGKKRDDRSSEDWKNCVSGTAPESNAAETEYLSGHTTRYLSVLVPASSLRGGCASDGLLRVRLVEAREGTPWCVGQVVD